MPPDLGDGWSAPPAVDADGEEGGEGCLGFHVANPAGLGLGGGGVAGPGAAAPPFSKAAILSRREPGFGLTGGDG